MKQYRDYIEQMINDYLVDSYQFYWANYKDEDELNSWAMGRHILEFDKITDVIKTKESN